tara:strand:- start:2912 stop:3199 length:288 start_codon:yes stop_codon:yes gene_type:complete
VSSEIIRSLSRFHFLHNQSTAISPALSISLERFLTILKLCEIEYDEPASKTKTSRWYNRIASLRKRQRAFGTACELSSWRTDLGWSTTGTPLPAD